jgi:hypothetical protein
MLNNICKLINEFLKEIGSKLDTLNDPDKYDLALEIMSDPYY